jgi:glycosyltransferase involved in cell wall biosynthesis
MLRTAFFTICAKNYIPYARTLFDSLQENYSDVSFYLILADRLDGYAIDLASGITLVEAGQLPIDDLEGMTFRYDITEFNTAIKPASFRYIFDNSTHDSVVYIDPDILVVSPLVEMQELLESGAQAVLTPHICEPVEDGEKPDDLSMLNAGIYNLGFLALKRNEEVLRFVDWWHRRLIKDCRIDLAQGLFVDQKWVDLLPCFVANAAVLRHPGYNAAYWNLMHRHIELQNGKWRSNGEPLRFFHFSGIDVRNDKMFSKHQTRFDMSNIGDLKMLAREYRKRVMENGQAELGGLPYAYDRAANGEYIPAVVRRIYRECVEPSAPPGADRYVASVAYCNELEQTVVQAPGVPINRLMYRIWQAREDLQLAFDLTTSEGREGFLNWYLQSAEREIGLGRAFLEHLQANPQPAVASTAGVAPPVARSRWGERALRRIISRSAANAIAFAPRLQSVYRHISPPVRQRLRVSLIKLVSVDNSTRKRGHNGIRQQPDGGAGDAAVSSPDSAAVSAQHAAGLRAGALLIGYPKAELGMGEHVRLSAQSFMESRIPFGIYNFDHSVVARQQDDRYSALITDKPEYKANVFHINADQMEVARDVLGTGFFSGRYNIGYWAWELSRFPDIWLPAIDLVDEIWAPSRFIQNSISERARCPVVWMPLAVKAVPLNRELSIDFGVADDDFVFMFYFDFASFATRKNPEAPIEAFKRAFDHKQDNVRLVIKVMGNYVHRPEIDRLKKRVSSDPRIVVIDEVLSHEEMALLVNRCNCFVSLHRSEGFGRGMAEAMVNGKPVIATNYSGNTDFMNEKTGLLVDYALVPVEKGCYVHWEDQVWAEPDIDHAAWYMRKVFEDREFADSIGVAGKAFIEQHHSPDVVAARYRDRLQRLGVL